MRNGEKPIANPVVILREEFDDWAVLFDADSGNAFGLSPTGAFLWKLLDGEHTIDDLLENMRHHADDVPEDVRDHIGSFVDELIAQGLAGFDITEFCLGPGLEKSSSSPSAALGEVKTFNYERPRLVNLNTDAAASGATCSSNGSAGGDCTSGGTATGCCLSGACGNSSSQCCAGSCGDPSGCDCWHGNTAPSGNCYDGCSPIEYTRSCRCGTCPYPDGTPACSIGA